MPQQNSTSDWRETALNVASKTGLFHLMRQFQGERLLILTYHSVVDVAPEKMREHPFLYRNAIHASRFEEQLAFLKKHYTAIPAQAVVDGLEKKAFPERAVHITFDDGLKNNATVAAPLLQKYDLPATYFLPTGFVDAASQNEQRLHWTDWLAAALLQEAANAASNGSDMRGALPSRWPEPTSLEGGPGEPFIETLLEHLKTIPTERRRTELDAFREKLNAKVAPERYPADSDGHSLFHTMTWQDAANLPPNISFGGHGVNHEILTNVPDDTARREIAHCKERIETKTGKRCLLFAFPNGTDRDFAVRHQTMIHDAGYRGALTQIAGFNKPNAGRFSLKRIDTSPNHELPTFQYLTCGLKQAVIDPLLRG